MTKRFEITPTEIVNKEFTVGLRGYKKEEVDDFLEKMAGYVNYLQSLVGGIEEGNPPPRLESNDAIPDGKEDLISKTLLLAERTKDELIINAKKEAENLTNEASLKAKKIVNDAKQYIAILEHQIYSLEDKKRNLLMKFKVELESMLNEINSDSLLAAKNKKEQAEPILPVDSVNEEAIADKIENEDKQEIENAGKN